jgi:glutathione S-transferase
MIRIYNFAGGARGIRAFWVCEEIGQPYEAVEVAFPPSQEYRRLNPLGSVPFLEDDGVAINESVAIMLYLAQRYGPGTLLPAADDPAFARVLQFAVFGEASLASGMNPLLTAHFGAPSAEKRNWSVLTQEARVEQFVDYAAQQLGASEYLVGEHFTLADVSVVTALAIWRNALRKTIPQPLADYAARMMERESYQRARSAQGPRI